MQRLDAKVKIFSLFAVVFLSLPVYSQSNIYSAKVVGCKNCSKIKIIDSEGAVLTSVDSLGKFEFILPYEPYLYFGSFGAYNDEKIFGKYARKSTSIDSISIGAGLDLIGQVEVNIEGSTPFMDEIRMRDLTLNAGVGSGVENLIKTLGGVSSNNELSSQFSVRGGNFDENLIYVNDIEIYRPQLIQNGQQEGLSFINPQLVDKIKFSAGGFESQYGDKMSSVLDVQYIKPDSTRASISLGTMINCITVEGSTKKISGLLSIRHFTNSLLTGTLNTKGTYSMNFADVQSFLKWDISKRWSMDFFGNLAGNAFQLIPESKTTEFGTIQSAYQLNVFMAGQENLNYNYSLGALTLNFRPSIRQNFKWILSATAINEEEHFDIQGAYNLSELDRDLGSSNLGKPLKTLGYGYYLDHGRNQMQSRIFNFSHLGNFGKQNARTQIKYGIRLNKEFIVDRFYEWLYMDSADYNLAPWSFAKDTIILDDITRSNNRLTSTRLNGFVQVKHFIDRNKKLSLNAGFRASWWSVNEELLLMPRISLFYEPNKLLKYDSRDTNQKLPVTYRFSFGAYHQPPFYREIRGLSGSLNPMTRAQKSFHWVLGMDRVVTLWNRKFKYTSEAYYKYLNDLIPYYYDNIRIRYFAENTSTGYAAGFDNRLYGQFNKGLESWFTLSLLQSKERIIYTDANGNPVISDWLRRPTDRRANLAVIFQDRLKQNPSIRVNLSMVIGTNIPYYLDGLARYSNTPSIVPPYRRVDIGFSKTLREPGSKSKKYPFIKQSWLSVDVFNLLDINNVIAYSWVKDLENNRYGVPEYLTGRRLNVRFFLGF